MHLELFTFRQSPSGCLQLVTRWPIVLPCFSPLSLVQVVSLINPNHENSLLKEFTLKMPQNRQWKNEMNKCECIILLRFWKNAGFQFLENSHKTSVLFYTVIRFHSLFLL
ncbi:uncharacterized protein LOC105738204 [Nomascus leucogenys]|uniref:uncharacterized protein LOC105738204 n=1 Tax=Nomascus leucogenys TaxID=61853 RepID=UPI00122D933D|nr:uncharacterized protein LOC105738204 [Nomascus leucogenys]